MLRHVVLLIICLLIACANTDEPPTADTTPNAPAIAPRVLPEWAQLSELSGTRLHTSAGQLWLTDGGSAGWHSADYGITWQPNALNEEAVVLTAGIEGQLWYAAGRGTFYRSSDLGQTWQPILQAANYLQPSVTVTNRGSVFVSSGGQCQLQRSRDNGESWQILPIQEADCFPARIVASPNYAVDQTLYVLTAQRGIFASHDAGVNWQRLTTLAAAEFVIDPTNPNTLYLIADGQLYRSLDAGMQWEPLQLVPEETIKSTTLTILPNGTLYVGTLTGLLFDSADNGTTFRNIPLAGEIETVRSVVFTNNTLFLLTRHGIYGGYLSASALPPIPTLAASPALPSPTAEVAYPIATAESVVPPTVTPLQSTPTSDAEFIPTLVPEATDEPVATPQPTPTDEDGYPMSDEDGYPVTEPTLTSEADLIPLEPDVMASYILFDSWSPDGQIAAFWTSDDDDIAAQLPASQPGGVLTFYDLAELETCTVAVVHTEMAGSAELFWQPDGSVIAFYDDTAYQGDPCDNFAELDDFTPPISQTPDPALSADGSYRVETVQQGRDNGILNFETTLYAGDRAVVVAAWQIDERLGDYADFLGGEWVSPTQFVIYETFSQGPLLLDGENEVVIEVLTELFELDEIPNMAEDEFALRIRPIPSPITDRYHLLTAGVGSESAFPAVMLYHAETGLVETLPSTHLWTPAAVNGWIIINTPDSTTGSERFNLSRRRVEDVDGTWQPFVSDVDATVWDAEFEQLVTVQGEETVVWQDWERGEVFGRYSTDPFWITPTPFSPTGNHIALVGNQPGQDVYGIFFIARE